MWAKALYFVSYKLHSHTSESHRPGALSKALNRAEWQTQWLNQDLLQPWDPLPIHVKCNETNWVPNLVFDIFGADGGVGNVHAQFLDFLFYAIESGASILLPSMAVRREDNLHDWGDVGEVDLSYMFDEIWFRKAMREACPQMRIYGSEEELGEGWREVESTYDPRSPRSRKDSSQREWKQQTEAWLSQHHITGDVPTVVPIQQSMWETNTRAERPAFRRALGTLLRVRPDVRRYAAIAMFNLAASEGLDLSPTDRIHRKAFYGAHLRTEQDTISAGWLAPPSDTEFGLNFTLQTSYYMQAAVAQGLSIILVASGNASEVERFRQVAAANRPPLTVLSKWDLLSEAERDALEEYSVVEDSWSTAHRDRLVVFENKLSKIWGKNQFNEERVPKGAWP